MVQDMQADHQQRLSSTQDSFAARIAELQEEHKAEVARMNQQQAKARSELRRQESLAKMQQGFVAEVESKDNRISDLEVQVAALQASLAASKLQSERQAAEAQRALDDYEAAANHTVAQLSAFGIQSLLHTQQDSAAAASPGNESSKPRSLKCVLFVGSARTQPMAKIADDAGRLGDRVVSFILQQADAWSQAVPSRPQLDIEILDPLHIPLFQSVLGQPVYYMDPADITEEQRVLCDKVQSADCYLIVTPEYNHTMPHVLTNMMNFFARDDYAHKPSACICYSMNAYGGPHVAAALRPYLSELGCLPISKALVLGDAFGLFDPVGKLRDEENRAGKVLNQTDKLLEELVWWAQICRVGRHM